MSKAEDARHCCCQAVKSQAQFANQLLLLLMIKAIFVVDINSFIRLQVQPMASSNVFGTIILYKQQTSSTFNLPLRYWLSSRHDAWLCINTHSRYRMYLKYGTPSPILFLGTKTQFGMMVNQHLSMF